VEPQFLLKEHAAASLALDQRALDHHVAGKAQIHTAYPLRLVQHQNHVAMNRVSRVPGAMSVFQLDEKVVAIGRRRQPRPKVGPELVESRFHGGDEELKKERDKLFCQRKKFLAAVSWGRVEQVVGNQKTQI
jgi:hypothetical protein